MYVTDSAHSLIRPWGFFGDHVLCYTLADQPLCFCSDHLLSRSCWSISQWCSFEATSHHVHKHNVIWHDSMCQLGDCRCLQRLGSTWGHWPKRELGKGQRPPKQQPRKTVRGCGHRPQVEMKGSPTHWRLSQELEVSKEQAGKPTCCNNSHNHRCKNPELEIDDQNPKMCPLDYIY